jgi:hypothetical protein
MLKSELAVFIREGFICSEGKKQSDIFGTTGTV